jgi:beta-galactosidase
MQIAVQAMLLAFPPIGAGVLAAQSAPPPLQVKGRGFTLNGAPFQILSGELEYARIPRADWRDRLRKVRALGLNTITVYVFWNLHEPKPGVYDFSEQNDVAEFLREAQAEGLYVVLRPGPYVCAEWDLGGYPAWLLKDRGMVLRSSEESYLAPVRRWMMRLGRELAPLQASRGGPIIAVQVENEYGSFQAPSDGGAYMRTMEHMMRDAGFGESLLYTADGGDELTKGSLPGLPAAVDFGTGDAERSLKLLHAFRPEGPVFIAEYWDGWFDHWGDKHQTTDAATQVAEIRAAIAKGYSISLYMIHGGTSFGWMNGANWDDGKYEPDVSSYDYDAPIDESGRPRPKYFALRTMIAEVTHRTPPPVPDSAPMLVLPEVKLTESKSLWRLPAEGTLNGVYSEKLLSMEDMDQAYGYILYRRWLDSEDVAGPGVFQVEGLHSYARVYLDGKQVGILDRRLGQTGLKIDAKAGQMLDVLVENSGRINFTTKLRGERAGIVGSMTLDGHSVAAGEIFSLPSDQPPKDGYRKQDCRGPCFFRGTLQVSAPGDTFLNTERLGKGVVWVNGHLLGRFWNIGPMASLYLPGVWLHAGANDIVVLDLDGNKSVTVRGDDHPTYIVTSSASAAH